MLTRSKRKHSLGKKPLKKRRSVKQYSKNIKGGNYKIDAEGYYVLNDNNGTPYRVCKEVSEETLYLMYNGRMYSRSVVLNDGLIFKRTTPKDIRTLGYSSLSFIEPKTYINHNGDKFFANGYNAEHINNFKKERAKIIEDSLIEFKRDLVVRINQKLPYNELKKIYNDKMKVYNEKKFSIQVKIGLVNKEIGLVNKEIEQIDKQIEQIDTQIKTQKDSIDNIDNIPLEKYRKKNNKNLSRNNAKAQELKLQHEENARKFEEKQKEDIKERYSLKIVELEKSKVELENSRVELENRRVERIPEIQALEQELHDSVEIPIIALTEEYNRELNKLDAIPENIESPQPFIPDRPIETIRKF